jgi:hypothetical protein
MESKNVLFEEPIQKVKVCTTWGNDDKPFEQLPLTAFEINLNKDFITPEKLLEQEKKEEEEKLNKQESEEEKTKRLRRDYITKVKVIALDMMGKQPLSNPSFFSTRDKKKLIQKMEEVMKFSEDELTAIFNGICTEVLFAPEANYQYYPVYNV